MDELTLMMEGINGLRVMMRVGSSFFFWYAGMKNAINHNPLYKMDGMAR